MPPRIETRFPKSVRLLSPADFGRVFKDPKRSTDRFFTVLFRENGLCRPRLGLAISKKHIKRAVDRNLVKRLIRESFREYQAELGGSDIVVLSRRDMELTSKELLTESLDKHWRRICRNGGDGR